MNNTLALARAFVVLAFAFIWFWLSMIAKAQEPRYGHVVISGTIEADKRYPSIHIIDGMLISVHPYGIPETILRMYHGKKVEIVIRETK